jgi:hypothetical protein
MKKLITFILAIMIATGSLAQDNTIKTESKSESTVNSNNKSDTTVKSTPPSAVSPSINATNTDLCTVGISGAVQTQILGISTGQTYTDENCERLKNAKTLYDMGMKVAAVSLMCQDKRVFDAMMSAGTPCPYNGKIGDEAKELWNDNKKDIPKKVTKETDREQVKQGMLQGALGVLLIVLLL